MYKRFAKWSEAGIFEKIFTDLAAESDMQDISIDSTCIKAHKASAGAKREILTAPIKTAQKLTRSARNTRKTNALGSLAVVEIQRFTQ